MLFCFYEQKMYEPDIISLISIVIESIGAKIIFQNSILSTQRNTQAESMEMSFLGGYVALGPLT